MFLEMMVCLLMVLLLSSCSTKDNGFSTNFGDVVFKTNTEGVLSRNDSIQFTPLSEIEQAFQNQRSDFQITQQGIIVAVLADDTVGDRHQRIIVMLENDQTLLIAHNIDIAPRVPDPVKGELLCFCGEYEWNDEGGVVHWTHKDPDGVHADGWLEYKGVRYQELPALSVIPR